LAGMTRLIWLSGITPLSSTMYVVPPIKETAPLPYGSADLIFTITLILFSIYNLYGLQQYTPKTADRGQQTDVKKKNTSDLEVFKLIYL
jgi:hypothetical protein